MTATRVFTPTEPPCRYPFYNGLGEEGCYYFNARWYDAFTGRFISEDPARDGANWYTYVVNNPLKYVDPTGMSRVDGDDPDDPDDERDKEQRAEDQRKKQEERKNNSDDENGGSKPEDKDKPTTAPIDGQTPEPITPGTELPDAVQEIIMEEWIVTGQEFISGAALVVTGSGMAVASGTGDFTFTNTVTGETFNASYNITQINKGGTYAQLGLSTNTVGNPIFETSAEFPAGTTSQEVAMSYEGPFSSISVGVGVVSVSYFEGGDWTGSSINTFAGGSTDLGVAIGEFDYELRYFYE